MLKHVNSSIFRSLQIKQNLINNQHYGSILRNPFNFYFSKKPDHHHKKKSGAPEVKAKTIQDYMTGPEHMKKNIIEVKNMQTTSEAYLEQQSLKTVIIEQRNLLQQSLKQQIELSMKKPQKSQNQSLRSRILTSYMVKEELNKYYIRRPLKYLQNIYFNLALVNILGYSWLEFTNNYNSIGWFFGCFSSPAAASVIALLIGYNFSFWIVRQAFHLHLSLKDISHSEISLISTTWRNIIEMSLIVSQFAVFAYCAAFGSPIALYKLYIILATTNFAHLTVNLYEILRATNIPIQTSLTDFVKIVSMSTLLLLIFAVYYIQVTSGSKPEDAFESSSYRERIIQIRAGYDQFKNYFKQKKYVMKEDEKINPEDG